MAYLLNPVVVFLTARFEPFFGKRCKTERKAKKISKVLSITLAVLFGITLITVLCVMIIPELIYSLTTLAKSLPWGVGAGHRLFAQRYRYRSVLGGDAQKLY